MKKLAVPLVLLSLLFGCALSIRPNPVDPGAVVNPADRSITIKRDQLQLKVRVQNVAVGGYSLEKAIASFYLVASNRSQYAQSLPLSSMRLIDDQGRNYSPLPSGDVDSLLNPVPEYLVPFPFVGYLDVTGLEAYRASSAMASEQPYVSQGLPSTKMIGAFSGDSLPAGGQVSGEVFFEIDLYQVASVNLLIHPAGFSAPLQFPFLIEK